MGKKISQASKDKLKKALLKLEEYVCSNNFARIEKIFRDERAEFKHKLLVLDMILKYEDSILSEYHKDCTGQYCSLFLNVFPLEQVKCYLESRTHDVNQLIGKPELSEALIAQKIAPTQDLSELVKIFKNLRSVEAQYKAEHSIDNEVVTSGEVESGIYDV